MTKPVSAVCVSYPSLALPAPPRFTIDIPEGWIAHGAPGVLAMVRPQLRIGSFNPNMTINADLVPADADELVVLREVTAGVISANAGAEVVRAAEVVEHGSLRSAMSAVRIPTGDHAPVLQVLTALIVDAGLPGDITYAFMIACTWSENDAEARETLHRIQESFTLVPSGDESVPGAP